MTLATALCAWEECRRGPEGGPGVFVPSRPWHRHCSTACRMAAATARDRAGRALLKDPAAEREEQSGLPPSALTTDPN